MIELELFISGRSVNSVTMIQRVQQVVALLEQMQGITNRRAAMVSTLVAVRSPEDPEPLIAVGRVSGEITKERRGTNGFGFDPVMWVPAFGKTFAELPVEVKNAHSHRGRAAIQMAALMREQWLGAAAP
jgi:XTP/dITP diphosphohydrolase